MTRLEILHSCGLTDEQIAASLPAEVLAEVLREAEQRPACSCGHEDDVHYEGCLDCDHGKSHGGNERRMSLTVEQLDRYERLWASQEFVFESYEREREVRHELIRMARETAARELCEQLRPERTGVALIMSTSQKRIDGTETKPYSARLWHDGHVLISFEADMPTEAWLGLAAMLGSRYQAQHG